MLENLAKQCQTIIDEHRINIKYNKFCTTEAFNKNIFIDEKIIR